MLTTFPRLLLKHATERGSAPAMREKEYGIWQAITWQEMAAMVEHLACGLHQAGLRQHDHMVVIGANRPRLYATMLAVQALGAVPIPLYQDAAAMGRLILGTTKTGAMSLLPISERGITKRVAYLGENILGISGLSAHDCRHHWATDAARNKTDPFSLQEAGGWSSLAMPRRYVKEAEISNQGVVLSAN